MMLKFCSALVVLLAVCYAQPTPAPKLAIPETFEAKFVLAIQSRGGESHEGTGDWWRSEQLKDALRIDNIKSTNGEMKFVDLDLFEQHVAYHIEGTHCEKREIPEQFKFPMIWMDFEEHGHFAGKKMEKVGNMSVEVYVWDMQIPGREDARAELWARVVSEEESVKEPYAMKKMDRRGEEAMIFTSFTAMAPPASGFDVPAACKMATTSHQRPPKPTGH